MTSLKQTLERQVSGKADAQPEWQVRVIICRLVIRDRVVVGASWLSISEVSIAETRGRMLAAL